MKQENEIKKSKARILELCTSMINGRIDVVIGSVEMFDNIMGVTPDRAYIEDVYTVFILVNSLAQTMPLHDKDRRLLSKDILKKYDTEIEDIKITYKQLNKI